MMKIREGQKPDEHAANLRKENEMLMDLVLTLMTIRDGYKDRSPHANGENDTNGENVPLQPKFGKSH